VFDVISFSVDAVGATDENAAPRAFGAVNAIYAECAISAADTFGATRTSRADSTIIAIVAVVAIDAAYATFAINAANATDTIFAIDAIETVYAPSLIESFTSSFSFLLAIMAQSTIPFRGNFRCEMHIVSFQS
jgi:hypothetical protein